MFKFLKEKLKSWISGSKKEIENEEKKKQIVEKPKKKEKKEKRTERKQEEKAEERKVSERVIEDVKREKGTEEIKPIPRQEEISEEIKEVEREIEEEKLEEKKEGFFARLAKKFTSIKITESEFNEIFENLELILLENNVALEVVDSIRNNLRKELIDKEIKKGEIEKEILLALRNSIDKLLLEPFSILERIKNKNEPFVIVFFGINGSGKTTTIAKLTHYLLKNKLSCVLAAGDTFRAASIEQLSKHASKLGVEVIKHDYGSDPAAVAFDTIKHAKSHKIKVVLIDTAGRMHTKANLLAEMEKIVRVTKPDLKIFVAESITGNDATEQAKNFNEAIGIDGIILTKADVDEKGGTSLSVSQVTGKPILFLGMGQKMDDLKPFNKEEIIKNLGLE